MTEPQPITDLGAAMDQVMAANENRAKLCATFWQSLMRQGCDVELARELVRDWHSATFLDTDTEDEAE